jgi:hypothetical protein
MVRENVAALDIPPSVPVEKQEIAEFAFDLCETFARKYVNELFIKAYNQAEAQVIEAVRDGDILTIKVRFKPLVDHKTETLYGSISKRDYEKSFYVLAGNKKHLLLTDSHNQPLTSPSVVLSVSKDSPIAGTWYGKFPAPPKNIAKVSLTIPNVETLDGIKITDR